MSNWKKSSGLETLQSVVNGLPLYGDRRAIGLRQEYGVHWWTYRELYERAYWVAARLQSLGIKRGERLIIWASNSPEWVAALLGAALRGLVVVPVDENASPGEVQRVAALVQAVLLVHSRGKSVPACTLSTLPLETLSQPCPFSAEAELVAPIRPDDPALILYTSGTSEAAKGVVLSHRNLVVQIERFRGWRWITWLVPVRLLSLSPLSHIQGLLLGICVPLSIGLTVIYSNSVHPFHVIRVLRDNRVTLLVAVPRVQHLLAQALLQMPYRDGRETLGQRAQRIHLFLLRRDFLFRATHRIVGYWFGVLLVGGARLPESDERFWHEAGYVLVQGYGLTETSALVSLNINLPFKRPSGSIGKPLENQTIKLAADGEILVSGPSVTPGYLQPGAELATVARDEWLRTGDLARRDAHGRLYFLGRKKDIIVTGEAHNVNPFAVESVLQRLPGVRDAVVFGLVREEQEQVHAVLLLEPGAHPAQLVARANEILERHEQIQSWTVWPEADMPRTSLQKVKREAVQAAVKRGLTSSDGAERAVDETRLEQIGAINDHTRRLDTLARYITDTPLDRPREEKLRLGADFGLSSLDVVELLSRIARRGSALPDGSFLPQDASLADLHQLLAAPHVQVPMPSSFAKTTVRMDNPLLSLLRTPLVPLILPAWFRALARLDVHGVEHVANLRPPVIVAAAHHRHGSDVMATYCALPRHLRARMLVVTTHWIFRDYLEASRHATLARQLVIAFGFYIGMPLLFPYTLWPRFGTTFDGLVETCRLIDRGYSAVVFPDGEPGDDGYRLQSGIGVVAAQTQIPIVPLLLKGNDKIDFHLKRHREQIGVHFGKPLYVKAESTAEEVTLMLQEELKSISRRANGQN